jgi:hypothetical protein
MSELRFLNNEPVFDLQIWDLPEVLDVVGYYGETFQQSCCAYEDIFNVDRASFGTQMCQNIPS